MSSGDSCARWRGRLTKGEGDPIAYRLGKRREEAGDPAGGRRGSITYSARSPAGKHPMTRTLRILMRRDPSRDRQEDSVRLEGYEILWPDGRPLGIGFDAFCRQGQRLFGLGRHLQGRGEALVEMTYHPLAGGDDGLTRLPGRRVRRFYLRREGRLGRLHFFNGTPTSIVLDLDRDEQPVLDWIGLPALGEGESGWFDLSASTAEAGQELPMAGAGPQEPRPLPPEPPIAEATSADAPAPTD
jgi:hypothetical protein